jgi:hypothetical protein
MDEPNGRDLMRIQETNQILKEASIDRLEHSRAEDNGSLPAWLSSRTTGVGLAVVAAAVAVGVAVWQWRRTSEVSLFKL